MDKIKIYRRSGVSVACYVFAAIILIYTCYTAGGTVNQINEYYAQYGMSAQASEYITYVAQSVLPYLFYAVATFMLGYILDAVRKTDPKNYMTEEEYADLKAAKKEAKEAKKIAKGEKKAAAKAASEANNEQSMAEDFASDLDKELKAAEKKNDYKKYNGYKKSYNQNRNGNNNHRQSGNKSGGNGNGNRNGNGNGNVNRKYNNQNNQNGQNNGQNNNNNNQNNNQSKPVVEQKKAAEAQEKSAAVFEAKIVEDK